jgi:hypothetical protein
MLSLTSDREVDCAADSRMHRRIEERGLQLRRVELRDLDALVAVHGDPRTNEHNPAGPLPDTAAGQLLLERWVHATPVIARMQPSNRSSERVALRVGLRHVGHDPEGRLVLADRALSPALLSSLPVGS